MAASSSLGKRTAAVLESISGFYFDVCVLNRVSVYICLPNYNEISGGHIWRGLVRRRCSAGPVLPLCARATPVLSRFNYDAVPSLSRCYRIIAFFAADTLLYAVVFDLWPWTFAAYRLWRDETLYQICTQSSNLRRSYCASYISTCVTCCARLCDNFHQVWPSTVYPCLNYSVFFWCWYVMSRCDLDLWPVDFESSWYVIQQAAIS